MKIETIFILSTYAFWVAQIAFINYIDQLYLSSH